MKTIFYPDTQCRWQFSKDQSLALRGHLFLDGEEKGVEELATLLPDPKNPDEIKSFLARTNGCFSIMRDGDIPFLATDLDRSFPLFFRGEKKGDTPKLGECTLDELALEEIRLMGYTLGNRTIYREVKGLRAAEFAYYDGTDWNVSSYWDYKNGGEKLNPDLFVEELDRLYTRVFERAIRVANGRTVVIPLSGGEDSRLVIHYLHKLQYPKVLCYSYGVKGNEESEISKKVAEYYGYDWHFVEYTEKRWREFFDSKEYETIATYETAAMSAPHIQDIPAVLTLSEEGILPKDSIFMPGHTGDHLQGSSILQFVLTQGRISPKVLQEGLKGHHFRLLPLSEFSKETLQAIEADLLAVVPGLSQAQTGRSAGDIVEDFCWREKITKFINTSMRVYEYLGYDYWTPLWDRELVEYWNKPSRNLKIGRTIHRYYASKMQKGLWEHLGKEGESPLITPQKLRVADHLKFFFPVPMRNRKLSAMREEYQKARKTSPLLWEHILSEEEFEKRASRYESINGAVAENWVERLQKKFEE